MKTSAVILLILVYAVGFYGQIFPELETLDSLFMDEPLRDPDLGSRGGLGITASGVLRVPVIFVDWADETVESTNWPIGGDPLYMQDFIDSQPYVAGQVWPRLNLSNYMHTMSISGKTCTIGKLDARSLQNDCIYGNLILDGVVTGSKMPMKRLAVNTCKMDSFPYLSCNTSYSL